MVNLRAPRCGIVVCLALATVGCASTVAPDRRATSTVPPPGPPRATAVARPVVPDGWLGGLRELDIDAPPDIVMDVLADPEANRRTMPFVRSLDVIGQGPQGEALMTIVQGTALVHGRYTAHLLRERADRIHIWLDGALPHDIEAADGFAEVRPREGGGSHLTWFLAFDVGATTRFLFGGKIQRAAMSTPERVRALAEERARERNASP